LFEVPQGAAEPEGHAQLSDLDDDGTHVEAVAVHWKKTTHHVEHKETDDQALHECIGDNAKAGGSLLLDVDLQMLQLHK